jgi:hypothetical protein
MKRALLAIAITFTTSLCGMLLFMQQFGKHFGEVASTTHTQSVSDTISSILAFVLGFPGTLLLLSGINMPTVVVVHLAVQLALAYWLASFVTGDG